MTSKDVDSESEFSTYDNLNFKHMTYIKTRPASSTYTETHEILSMIHIVRTKAKTYSKRV